MDAAAVGDQHVEADERRLGGTGRGSLPMETRLIVMGVDRAPEAEDVAGELLLDGPR
ncbi:MAG: hypothetical protein WBP81_20325 [Solirubrobacteraceae bacterium]